jgi:transmembrane sensor
MYRDPEMDGLLVKYLLGEATVAERERVAAWSAQDAANRRYFDQFRQLWDASRNLAPEGLVHEDEAWERFQKRVGRRPFPVRWAAAAILLLLAGAGAWFYFAHRPLDLVADAAPLVQTLPDGTQVTLNKHSRLSFRERRVTLQGEAFFQVAPDETHPFVINIDGATVRVLGTSFNVRDRDGETEVTVETGKVAVSEGPRSLEVGEGERALIPAGGTSIRKAPVRSRLYQYYRTRSFVCKVTPLQDLVQVLNEAYDAHIRIENPAAGRMPLTSTFRDVPLDSLLDVVTQTLGLTWSGPNSKEAVIR